jgi:hypothetical protein
MQGQGLHETKDRQGRPTRTDRTSRPCRALMMRLRSGGYAPGTLSHKARGNHAGHTIVGRAGSLLVGVGVGEVVRKL